MSLMVHHNLLGVNEASLLQRRLYRAIRETMRAMAGRISGTAYWPAKKMLARHVWLDAEHADAVRNRVLELRFPKVDVDQEADRALMAVLERVPSTLSDAEFLLGVYKVIKPVVLAAIRSYLERSDPLGDAPSHRMLRTIVSEINEQLQEFSDVEREFPEQDVVAAEPWCGWLRDALANAGGLSRADSGAPLLERVGFSDREQYQIAALPRRDPRWLPAVTQVPPRPPQTPEEQLVWVAIDHVNEVWASEAPGALIWHYDGLPWSLYHGAARWAYDEMRHAMLGERRLQAWGFEIGRDVPMVADHWAGIATRGGLEALLFVIHGLEQGGPKWKAQLTAQLWKMGDPCGSQDCDFDWADESGHIRYGHEWIHALFPNMTKQEVIARTQNEVTLWKEWIAEKHATGQHGYDTFLPRIEEKCSRMEKVPAPEHFQPVGSSAATASYGSSG